MFTQLRFQNFKSWKDTREIRMAPLTGFFGTNSSGKTAILQFLLMLKQTVESSDRKIIISSNGAYINLGTTHDFIHQHKLPEMISYWLDWKPIELPLVPAISNSTNNVLTFGDPFLVRYKSLLRFYSQIYFDMKKIKVQEFTYAYQNDEEWNEIGVCLQDLDKNNESKFDYRIHASGKVISNLLNDRLYEEFKYNLSPAKCYDFSVLTSQLFGGSKFYSNFVSSYEVLFNNLYYLGPLREYPKRIYTWSGEQPQDMGKRGENAVAALLYMREENLQVQEKVAFWLRELKLVHEYKLEPIRPGRQEYEMLVRCTAGSSWVSIKEVGFGISQILPVLVLCYYAPRGSTIIFEQPEIHLHPSVQAGLADVFIDAIKTRDVQIIVESHSEHLLRRLQLGIAEQKQGMTDEDTALYFCRMGKDGASILETLQLDTYGNINNWPDDFFGDILGDLVKMTEAEMQRQMQESQN
uniref:DUF3696 domain-containing protein n=1 Tax=Cyanothece sp. (strain PCC 7425 / ATCC 29141) TaxID=395961 RepID=B8HK88_CYAP4